MAIGSICAEVAPNQNDTDQPSQRLNTSAINPEKKTSTLKRLLIVGCLGISTIGMTGCSLTAGISKGLTDCDCIDDFMVGYRNRAMAEKAWHCRRDSLCVSQFAREFKDGFIQGYLEVASGGTGCTPAIAPSDYWGWKYQSAGGHSAINAWFQGFPQGVKAAEEDGVGHWQGIRMNHFRQPATHPAAVAPLAIPSNQQPSVTNPFYPEDELDAEPSEDTDWDAVDPSDIESIETPDSPELDESVFDSLFPPVAVDHAHEHETASSPAAVIADGSISNDGDNDSLPFSFE